MFIDYTVDKGETDARTFVLVAAVDKGTEFHKNLFGQSPPDNLGSLKVRPCEAWQGP